MEHSEVDPAPVPEERDYEAALRPKSLAEFEGQPRVREQLGLVLDAARHRGSTPDHVLLSGPPGLGKTTLAMIIAAEMGTGLRISSGPAIQHAGDLAELELGKLAHVNARRHVFGEAFAREQGWTQQFGEGELAGRENLEPIVIDGGGER